MRGKRHCKLLVSKETLPNRTLVSTCREMLASRVCLVGYSGILRLHMLAGITLLLMLAGIPFFHYPGIPHLPMLTGIPLPSFPYACWYYPPLCFFMVPVHTRLPIACITRLPVHAGITHLPMLAGSFHIN